MERQAWNQALEAYRRLSALDPHDPEAYLGIVLMQARRGDLASVPAHFDSLPGASTTGRAYGSGVLLGMEGRLEESARELEGALRSYEALRHLRGEAACRTALGNVRLWSGRPEEAAGQYQAALSILERLGDRRAAADLRLNLAAVRRERGDEAGALGEQRRAARTYDQLGDRDGRAAALAAVGETLHRLGRLSGAAEAFGEAAAIRRELGDRAGEAAVLDRLGVILTALGEVEEADSALHQSRGIAVEIGDGAAEAAAMNDLANLRFAQGEYAEALLLQTRALELQRGLGDERGEGTSLVNLGATYHAIGDRGLAERNLRRAVERLERLGDRAGEAVARNNLGVLLADRGDLEGALREVGESIRIRDEIRDRRGAAFSRYNAADALMRAGRPDEASRYLEASLPVFREAGDRRGEAFVLNGIGDLRLRQADARSALAAHREALAVALRSGLAEEEAAARAGIARALERSGQEAAALEEYARAVDSAEEVRARLLTGDFKARYLEGKLSFYDGAVRLLARRALRGDAAAAARAFAFAERARARSLLDLLAEARASLRAGMDPDLGRRERILLARIAAAASRAAAAPEEADRARARGRLTAAEEALSLLEVEMRRNAPAYAEIAYPSPASMEEVRRGVLHDGEALLEYFLSEPTSFLWIVDRGGAALREIPGRAALEAGVSRLLAAEAGGAFEGDAGGREAASSLARAILPVPLPAAARLLIVPDGVLHHLPFEALEVDGRPLVEERETAYAPSASALRLLRAAPAAAPGGGFLGVGGPALPPAHAALPPLPFAREEVERLAGLFHEGERIVLGGSSATEAAVSGMDLTRFRFVHFAAHGLVEEEDPSRSGIVLAASGNDPGDGLLTMSEIFGLRLRSQVVTLSACRSGLGRLLGGEGIVGLTRAFLYAGARSVVVSLWNLNDRSTAEFMEAFYRGLREGRAASAALREAKLQFAGSRVPGYRRPARWAPFILVGDPGDPPIDGPGRTDPR